MENEKISEKFFEMLAQGQEEKEVIKKLGIRKVVKDKGEPIITIYYPDGAIISHWL